MHQVNRLIYEASANNGYATFFFATYNPSTRELRYVNAGHNPPLLLSADKRKVVRLEAAGLVIGLLPDIAYEEQTVELHSGDLLIAYTDGISEAMNVEGEEWGEERMLGAALRQDSSASETLRQIFEAADRFTTTATQHDDMTLLVMKVE
jgi:phosphoserine phosphatase RsbU/P